MTVPLPILDTTEVARTARAPLKHLARLIFKRKAIILCFLGGTVCTVALVVLFFTKLKYEATAQILLHMGREHVSDVTLQTTGAVRPTVSFDAVEQTTLTGQILRGRLLVERVVQTIGATRIYGDLKRSRKGSLARLIESKPRTQEEMLEIAVLRVQDNLHTAQVGSTPMLDVIFSHEDPNMAAKVVNTLVNLYLDRHLGIHTDPKLSKFFEQQFEALKQQRSRGQRNLDEFKSRHAVSGSFEEERQLLLAQRIALETALNEAESQRAGTEKRIEFFRGRSVGGSPAVNSRNDARITAAQEKLADMEIRELEYSMNYTEKNPSLWDLRNKIRSVRQHLVTLEGGQARSATRFRDAASFQNMQEKLLAEEADFKVSSAKQASLSERLREVQHGMANLDRIEDEYKDLEQRVKLALEGYRLYSTKYEESRISQAMDREKIASLKVIELARPPVTPLPPRRFLKLGLALLFGVVGGIGLAATIELRQGSFETVEDVEGTLQIPVLASIPDYRLLQSVR